MRLCRTAIPFLFLIVGVNAFSQQLFPVNADRHCRYGSEPIENELFRYQSSEKVLAIIEEILIVSGSVQNFEIIETNVETVAAVVDSTKRYLLYSLDFVERSTELEVYATFAHEIGHHVNLHQFVEEHRFLEESEADFFMGYFLSKKAVTPSAVESFIKDHPLPYNIQVAERLKTTMDGHIKGTKAILIKSLSVDTDPKAQELLLPAFTFKKCYTYYNFPKEKFADAKTLSKVDEKIRLALDRRGYTKRSYFSVREGFAIVTQMEQFNHTDGSIRNDRTRWLNYPVRDNFSNLLDYISSIIFPHKGHFRTFVFVVTNSAFLATNKPITKQEAEEWLCQGANRLPSKIADKIFSKDHVVSVLVYEFEVPESNRAAVQVCPAPILDARMHLVQSQISNTFGF